MKTKIVKETLFGRKCSDLTLGSRTSARSGIRDDRRILGWFLTVILMGGVQLSWAQTFSEKINKEGAFERAAATNTVIVANINGHVTVQGYDGTKVMVEVTKTIRAKTDQRLEQGKKDVQLGMMDRADTLIYYISGICQPFGKNTESKNWSNSPWSYQWNDCKGDRCDLPYDYKMDFIVKVPKGVNVIVSTINEGDIEVANTNSVVLANNINGSIKLSQLESKSVASTINGDVDIDFTKNPLTECRFYSLNGDINALFQKGLAANMSFQSFNGELFTNVPQLESLPIALLKEETKKGTKYKVSGSRYKIGRGGPLLDFETFNGDVYLKEK